jgi:hypothetical protein
MLGFNLNNMTESMVATVREESPENNMTESMVATVREESPERCAVCRKHAGFKAAGVGRNAKGSCKIHPKREAYH